MTATVVTGMKFRARDYSVEEAAASLPRLPTEQHPLAVSHSSRQVDLADNEKHDFEDPLRGPPRNLVSEHEVQNIHVSTSQDPPVNASQLSLKEWVAFRRSLMQKFPPVQTVSVSSKSDVIMKGGKGSEKSLATLHLEELEDPERAAKEEVKVITRQEYVSRLNELKDEIHHAWQADDRVKSLKLAIKVARLLMDTSVCQFYPTLFVLVTDVMDMLGDLVWERIKKRAEFSDDGMLVNLLPENFKASNVCDDAKETCNNWFCKIGSIRELLPRVYLELSILRCYRFLHDNYTRILHRLTMITRGLADPMASTYCRLYLAKCAFRLPLSNTGFLISLIKDITSILMPIISECTTSHRTPENRKLLITLLEPAIEWIAKCLFKHTLQCKVEDTLVELGLQRNLSTPTESSPFLSLILYHLLKEVPAEIVCSNVLDIVLLIESCKDISLDQYLNYRLLGLKLCNNKARLVCANAVLDKVFKVINQYGDVNEYLKVVDAFLDIVLQCQLDDYLVIIFDGISARASNKKMTENEFDSLESILTKLLTHFDDLEKIFALKHFVKILDLMHGVSRNIVNMQILTKATRNGYIHDPVSIQLLFEVSRSLHDSVDIKSITDDVHQQSGHLISHFVQMVKFGDDLERHLTFLVECRTAFGSTDELKESIVHSANCLAIKAIKDDNMMSGFVRSCIAFNEVTIPSISATVARMNLYLETAEVALMGGLVSHSDGLIDCAISTFHSFELMDGSRSMIDAGSALSSICKLCSLLVMVPGNTEQGVTHISKNILSFTTQCLSLTSRTKIFCAIISLSAALSQQKLPYSVCNREVVSNDQLFFGEPSYSQELLSFSSSVLQKLVDGIQQESSAVARGRMALEACNCLVLSFEVNDEISQICKKLIEIAKSCLHTNDKHLHSTVYFLHKQLLTHGKNIAIASV